MNYRLAVSEARRLTKRSEEDSWRLAQLSHQVCVIEKSANQRKWGADIGLSHTQVGIYVRAWDRFGKGRFQDRPLFWKACEAVRKGIEPEEANANRASRPGTIAKLPVADQAKIAREVLKNPRVVREVVSEPILADRLETALEQAVTRRPSPAPARADSAIDVISDFRKIHLAIERIAVAVNDGAVIRGDVGDALLSEVRWIRAALDHIEAGIKAGDLDDALVRLLEGGAA